MMHETKIDNDGNRDKTNWIKPSHVRNFGVFLVKSSTAEIAGDPKRILFVFVHTNIIHVSMTSVFVEREMKKTKMKLKNQSELNKAIKGVGDPNV